MVATFLSGGRVPPVEEVGRNGVEQHLRGPNLGGVNPIGPPLVGTTARYQRRPERSRMGTVRVTLNQRVM